MTGVLGAFEQAVLLAILGLGDEAYGRAVVNAVAQRLKRRVTVGAVHATLERLERKALVTSSLGSGTPVRAGRPRRFYRTTPAGIRALNEARAAFDALWRDIAWPVRMR